MTWLLIALAGLIIGCFAHIGLTALEKKGLIFYRHRPRIQFLGLLEEIVEPRVEYLMEEQSSEAIRADHAISGEDLAGEEGDV